MAATSTSPTVPATPAAPDKDDMNPISRLIQIQQAKKEQEPLYTLEEEKGAPRRREFVMSVSIQLRKLLQLQITSAMQNFIVKFVFRLKWEISHAKALAPTKS